MVVIEKELAACPEKKLKLDGFFKTLIIELISVLLFGRNLSKNPFVKSVATRMNTIKEMTVKVT
jgi:hypothetical protein